MEWKLNLIIVFKADISHAYQILKKHGIPADHIVTMMYDDLAHSEKFVLICHYFNKDLI